MKTGEVMTKRIVSVEPNASVLVPGEGERLVEATIALARAAPPS